ncbi:unnamed protein product [Brassica rapa subsp. trilocularis]
MGKLMCLLVRDGSKIKARDVSRENGCDTKTSCETFLHQEGSYILFGDGFLVSWGSTTQEKILHTISRQMGKLLKDDLDSSILKALEEEPKKERATDVKNLPAPIVTVDKDMFVLVDDAMLLMEKAILEPLPDESGPQNRMEVGKDGGREDEKRLTEFARRTLEVFILDHILCNKVEGAYKEVGGIYS